MDNNYNTGIGIQAFNTTSAGVDNTATGAGTLYFNTTGSYNTASGYQALYSNTTGGQNTASGWHSLLSNTTGSWNTASGYHALYANTTGYANTTSGSWALNFNTTGYDNTASGYQALYSNTTGGQNTASGAGALTYNTIGYNNTASGAGALYSNTTGNNNTAIGSQAGLIWDSNGNPIDFTGSDNIYIGYNVGPGSAGESYTIKIGNDQWLQGSTGSTYQTFIAGISGATVVGSAVYVNNSGQLGTLASSSRYKDDIEDMGDSSSGLMKLRPVTFHYKPEYAAEPRTVQYGLIAEEVAEVYPDLVQHDPKTGQPQTVYYHLVNAMLLNEVQKQQKRINALEEQVREVSALKEQVRKLSALLGQDKESFALSSKLEDQSER